jgi:uncharacterized membrane protein YdbT with pleckstrin-like domain
VGYVETILEPGERIAHRAYLHWIVYLRGIILVIFGGIIHFAAPEPDLEYGGMVGVNRWAIAGVLVLLGAASLLRAAINRWTTEIAVTDRRVILKRGLITRDTIEINLPKVESVDVRQSILGRLLNYGTVIVRGTGGGLNPLSYVSAPLPLRRAVQLPSQTSTSPAWSPRTAMRQLAGPRWPRSRSHGAGVKTGYSAGWKGCPCRPPCLLT